MITNMLKQTKLEDKTVKSTQLLLVLVGLHDFQIFVERMCEAWKWKKICSISVFSSKSAVKYLHVGQRKIHISPPLGEQDQLNALPQGQQKQSNPHPMPCLPPPPNRLYSDVPINGLPQDGRGATHRKFPFLGRAN